MAGVMLLKCSSCGASICRSTKHRSRDLKWNNFCSLKCKGAWVKSHNPVPKGSSRDDAFKTKLSTLLSDKYRSGEVIHHMIGSHRLDSTKKKLSKYWTEKYYNDDGRLREQQSNVAKEFYNSLPESEKVRIRERQRDIANRNWDNPDFIKRWSESRERKPNGVERRASAILEKYGFRYVGDYSYWIGRKNPDFINISEKRVVEIFGRYYHDDDEVVSRIEHFKKYGWECFVFWEDELGKMKGVMGLE